MSSENEKNIPDATIGGGWIVLRRNSVGRLRAPRCPYEHADEASASKEAGRMSLLNPGTPYCAMQVGGVFLAEQPNE